MKDAPANIISSYGLFHISCDHESTSCTGRSSHQDCLIHVNCSYEPRLDGSDCGVLGEFVFCSRVLVPSGNYLSSATHFEHGIMISYETKAYNTLSEILIVSTAIDRGAYRLESRSALAGYVLSVDTDCLETTSVDKICQR